MDFNLLIENLILLDTYKYLILFLIMVIEGPIVTVVASFLASFDIFNLGLVFLIAIAGNVLPDLFFFTLGKKIRHKRVECWLTNLGISRERLIKLENNLKNHTKKAIVAIKITPATPIPSIILAGFLNLSYRRFFSISLVVDLILVLLYTITGFFAGTFGWNLLKFFKLEKYLILLAAAIIILIIILVNKEKSKLENTLVKNIK